MKHFLAVDIGASSGRHILGRVEGGRIRLSEVYRFENGMEKKDGHLCWDIDGLFGHVMAGMKACKDTGVVPESVGVDTWGCDFVLLDAAGNRLGPMVAYRDRRTEGIDAEVEKHLSFEELYGITGIQKLAFNTVYQLAALKRDDPAQLEKAERLLFVPDYLHYRLSGVMANEYTEASTSALLDAATKTWSEVVVGKLGFPKRLFGPLSVPGTVLGQLAPGVAAEAGFECRVVLPASHDTGSAYLAVPARDENAATISSGTWSLLGVESPVPVLSAAAREANFTNEGGYGYRYRFLQNIMGLWMIQSVRREQGKKHSYAELEQLARENADFTSVVDVNAPEFLSPDSMTEAVKAACQKSGQPVPETTGQLMQCIYISLAECYRSAIEKMGRITGRKFTSINIVGGGSKDGYLNSLTAKATGLPVYAGPTEGTVIGNLMVQMLASGEFADLAEARSAVAASFEVETFLP